MSEQILKAWEFATRQHGSQTYGTTILPYLYHLARVTERVRLRTTQEDIIIASILHDVVEDTDATIGQLEIMFGKRVAEIVDYLSRRDFTMTYREYIESIFPHPEATLIKTCDLQENLSNNPSSHQRQKYEEALEYLTGDSNGVYE